MRKYHNTRPALATLTAAVATQAAIFGVAALVLTEGAGYYVAFRMPSGYLTRTETYQRQAAALAEFKTKLVRNELAAAKN